MQWETYMETLFGMLLHIHWHQLGIAATIFFVFLLFRKLFTNYVFKLVVRLSKKAPAEVFTHALLAFEKPIRFLFIILGVYLALVYLPLSAEFMLSVKKIYRSLLIIAIGWGLYNFASEASIPFKRIGTRLDVEEDSMLIPFLSKMVRFLLIALMISIIAGEWGYDFSGFIAGLGLGGLAFALAAKDTIGNFFGGIIIITEKPFSKGDWIQTPSVEGTVEDITFRSTVIRTFAQAEVTVPNSTLSNEPITNWTKMGKRRITFQLGVMYSTPQEKLERVVKRIEEFLLQHDELDKEVVFVRFHEFNQFSLDIFLYFFTKTTVWGEWLAIKEEINFRILQILEEEGVCLALPSRSIYIEKYERDLLGDGERN